MRLDENYQARQPGDTASKEGWEGGQRWQRERPNQGSEGRLRGVPGRCRWHTTHDGRLRDCGGPRPRALPSPGMEPPKAAGWGATRFAPSFLKLSPTACPRTGVGVAAGSRGKWPGGKTAPRAEGTGREELRGDGPGGAPPNPGVPAGPLHTHSHRGWCS